eukprot:5414166-Pyramimonas_sp.AAC.1
MIGDEGVFALAKMLGPDDAGHMNSTLTTLNLRSEYTIITLGHMNSTLTTLNLRSEYTTRTLSSRARHEHMYGVRKESNQLEWNRIDGRVELSSDEMASYYIFGLDGRFHPRSEYHSLMCQNHHASRARHGHVCGRIEFSSGGVA